MEPHIVFGKDRRGQIDGGRKNDRRWSSTIDDIGNGSMKHVISYQPNLAVRPLTDHRNRHASRLSD